MVTLELLVVLAGTYIVCAVVAFLFGWYVTGPMVSGSRDVPISVLFKRRS